MAHPLLASLGSRGSSVPLPGRSPGWGWWAFTPYIRRRARVAIRLEAVTGGQPPLVRPLPPRLTRAGSGFSPRDQPREMSPAYGPLR